MRILYSPQRSDKQLTYEFNDEIITVTLNGQKDTFNFSTLPEGEIARNEDGSLAIETTLPILPIKNARRRSDGVLEIELLCFHGPDATQEERFPDWQEVG